MECGAAPDGPQLAPAIDGWDKLAMGRELRAAFAGAQIRMATDAKAAAHAEARWGVLAGRDPAIYLNLGTGLAAAIVAGGRVLSGEAGAAGEIGYNLRAIAETLLYWTGLHDRVASLPAQLAWPRREVSGPDEDRAAVESRLAADHQWIDAWTAWARDR